MLEPSVKQCCNLSVIIHVWAAGNQAQSLLTECATGAGLWGWFQKAHLKRLIVQWKAGINNEGSEGLLSKCWRSFLGHHVLFDICFAWKIGRTWESLPRSSAATSSLPSSQSPQHQHTAYVTSQRMGHCKQSHVLQNSGPYCKTASTNFSGHLRGQVNFETVLHPCYLQGWLRKGDKM